MIRNSFTLRVLVINFLVLALPLLIDSFIFFQNGYKDAMDDAKTLLRDAANLRTFGLLASQPVKHILLNELSYTLNLPSQIESKDFEKLTRQITEIAHYWDGDNQIFVLDLGKNGFYNIVATSDRSLLNTIFQSYQQLDLVMDQGSGTFLRYMYSRSAEKYIPSLFIAQVIESKETKKPVGILMVSANIENQLDTVLTPRQPFHNIQFAFLNRDGIVFKSTDSGLLGHYFRPISAKRLQQIKDTNQMGDIPIPQKPLPIIRENDQQFFEFIFRDRVQMAYQVYIPSDLHSIVSYSPKQQVFGSSARHFLLIYTIYALILVGGGATTYWISLWISRPLRQLSHVMGKVSQGDLDIRFKEAPLGFEINILGQMFNNTIETLFQNIQQAEDERVKKETYQREVRIGRQVQGSLLPRFIPKIPGVTVSGMYLPAKEVGGDFYEFQIKKSREGEDLLMMTVANVSGQGLSSCLCASPLRSLLRSNSTMSDSMSEILSSTNQAFIEDIAETGIVVNLAMGIFNRSNSQFSYYSCGHIPSLIRRTNGQIITLKQRGMPLGSDETNLTNHSPHAYIPETTQLAEGDMVIFYTDALCTAINPEKTAYSEDRFRKFLENRSWKTAQEALKDIESDIDAFTEGVQKEEEVIIVVLIVESANIAG